MTIVEDRPTPPAGTPQRRRPNRLLALLRNSWRQLTSMRTALVLLFLLAVAAIPGSVLPQRGVNIEKVNEFFVEHPELAPKLDRLGAFEVFGSVWFSAIYLLLFASLIGCIIPRLRDHVRALRTRPPAAPKRLERLPQHAELTGVDTDAEAVAAELRRRRWRVVVRGDGGLRREGVPQGDRQPALPHLADRRAARRGPRLLVRLARQQAAGGGRGDSSATPVSSTPRPISARRWTTPTCRRSA